MTAHHSWQWRSPHSNSYSTQFSIHSPVHPHYSMQPQIIKSIPFPSSYTSNSMGPENLTLSVLTYVTSEQSLSTRSRWSVTETASDEGIRVPFISKKTPDSRWRWRRMRWSGRPFSAHGAMRTQNNRISKQPPVKLGVL